MNLFRKLFKRSAKPGWKPLSETHPFYAALGSSGFDGWFDEQRDVPMTHISAAGRMYTPRSLPVQERICVEHAERILRHEFNLLGSGPYNPVDSSRQRQGEYTPIDWFLDPVKSLRFPTGFHYKDWDLMRDRPGSADVKFPWELARSQHFLTLAQAWKATGELRFAQEIMNQIKDFDEVNPVEHGVNWTCTMDVGIRAANWAVALDLVKSADLDRAELTSAYACLFEHALFIRDNLENHYEVTSNHYLSNIVGLHFVAALFRTLPVGQQWLEFCEESIPPELDVQILPDGADFESALPYHRLVLELFLASFRLGQHLERGFSEAYRQRLIQMVDYQAGTLRPDGRMPVLGDCDDGRLFIASNYGDWDRQDPRHVFWPAALCLDEPRWLKLGDEFARWEAAWWGFDTSHLDDPVFELERNQQLFPDAGVAINRDSEQFLMVTNPIVGTVGFGNHKHNEQLSFEYHDRGKPLVVDTGSYVYTGDFDGRNQFRSTRHHNTLMIDGVEQNEFNPEWLFRMFEKANPEHTHFEVEGSEVRYSGCHRGYEEQLDHGVTHTRTFAHSLETGHLSIDDILDGQGTHDLEWNFHFDPAVAVEKSGDNSFRIRHGELQWLLTGYGDFSACDVLPTWISPSYGVKVSSNQARFNASGFNFGNFGEGEGERSKVSWKFEISRLSA